MTHKMEVEPCDGFSLVKPLLPDKKHQENEVIKAKQEADEEIYASHHHKSIGTTGFFKACFNGLNALSGVGLVSVPYALSKGGWLSLILLFIISVVTWYTGLLIRRCMDLNSSIKTYPDIAEHAFGYKGRMVVSILLHLELYLVATGFLISEGDNLHNLLPDMVVLEVAGLKIGGSKQSFVVIIALIILPSVWLDDLSIVSYISASGVLASFIVIGSTAWAGAVDGVGFHRRGVLVSLAGLPTTVSLYTFCYCAHPVFPTLYTSMKHKHQFSQVLLLCFVISTIGYASMAVMGYLMFGSSVKSQVTLNLPIEKLSSRIAICTTLINPITKYSLMITPIRAAFENRLPRRYNKGPIRLLIRTTLLISTVIVALVFPFFGYLMALVGAFLSAIASMLLPCICYLKIFGNNQGLGYEPVIIMGILLFGISVVVVGTYTSLAQIIQPL